MQLRNKLLAAALISTAPLVTHAESNYQTGAGALTATAHVDFKIVIPKVLYLQVGTGPAAVPPFANNTTVDLITFTVPAANVGDSSVISGIGGDQTGGVVTAKVIGNNGTVTLACTNAGALNDGSGHTISYSQIATASSNANLPAPTLADTNCSTSPTLTATANVVNQSANWTYTYKNTAVVAQGTYGGGGVTNTGNGRVTYTAALP